MCWKNKHGKRRRETKASAQRKGSSNWHVFNSASNDVFRPLSFLFIYSSTTSNYFVSTTAERENLNQTRLDESTSEKWFKAEILSFFFFFFVFRHICHPLFDSSMKHIPLMFSIKFDKLKIISNRVLLYNTVFSFLFIALIFLLLFARSCPQFCDSLWRPFARFVILCRMGLRFLRSRAIKLSRTSLVDKRGSKIEIYLKFLCWEKISFNILLHCIINENSFFNLNVPVNIILYFCSLEFPFNYQITM